MCQGGVGLEKSTAEKTQEKLLVFLNYVHSVTGRTPHLNDASDVKLFGDFLTHMKEERKSAPGNLVTYITAVMRVVKFSAVATGKDVSPTYRGWAQGYERERAAEASDNTWEALSEKKRWLHWEEVMEVLRQQKAAYEQAATALGRAKEAVRLAVLLIYCCLPPGRALEYRLLTYERCDQDHLKVTVPTPPDKHSNVLFLSQHGERGGLYLGAHKTRKNMGAQKISMNELDYVLRHFDVYIEEHRPRLLALQSADPPTHNYLFVDTNGRSFKDNRTSSHWNNFVKRCFKLHTGVGIGPTTLRSSFVTHLLNPRSAQDDEGGICARNAPLRALPAASVRQKNK
jgi:integrase